MQGGRVMGRDEVVVYDGAACPSRVRKNEMSVVLAGVQGDPDHLQLPQGNFEAVSLRVAARFLLFDSIFIDKSIFCHNNSKVWLQTPVNPCSRGICCDGCRHMT